MIQVDTPSIPESGARGGIRCSDLVGSSRSRRRKSDGGCTREINRYPDASRRARTPNRPIKTVAVEFALAIPPRARSLARAQCALC